MANKLIETAFKRGALSMPTTIEVEQVEKVGKTLHATYMFTKGDIESESFGMIANLVPDPQAGT